MSEDPRAAMYAAARQVFGDMPIEMTERGIRFPMGLFPASSLKERPCHEVVQRMLKNEAEGDVFLAKASTDRVSRSMRANLLRYRADKAMKERKFERAAKLYLEGAEIFCGVKLPTSTAVSKAYMDLDKRWDTYDTMACFTGAAKALMNMKDYAQALLWLGESHHVFSNARWDSLKDEPTFEWFQMNFDVEQHYLQIFHLEDTLADVYLKLGNTGANVYYRFHAHCTIVNLPSHFVSPETKRLRSEVGAKLNQTSVYRHPEPTLVARLDVVDDKSHVHGSWRKIDLKHPGGMNSRMGAAVFVHKSYLYVAGGEKFSNGPYYDEMWRINLAKMNKWEPLETVPPSLDSEHTGFKLALGADDKAYYFMGMPLMNYFDLRTQKWCPLLTRIEPSGKDWWPFITLQDYCAHCIGDRLYIFGGRHSDAQLGCNLLMELNLTTRIWRRLSGSAIPKKASFTEPGPRVNACSWAGKGGKKLYIMYGDADRMTAQRAGQMEGRLGMSSYGYDDLWSWDIQAETWTREKVVGNPPSPRSEMALAYNPVLDKVITFGGYSPSAPTFQNKEAFVYSYYADTFICDFNPSHTTAVPAKASASSLCATSATVDSTPAKWRQILTRGFPTYRAQSHLVVDPATGKTYLFSGYVNTEYVPSRLNQISRSFADLWELRINIPGGHFGGVDLEEEARTAKAGPWQRCFACGSAGPWKKCGGSCRGRVFFCSTQCLKDGWREHKDNHKCRKV